MYAVAVAFVTLAAASSSAATSISARTPGLFLRQLDPSSYPAQCQPTCSSSLGTIQSCTDVACMCTDSINQDLAACVDCILGSDGTTPSASLISQAQQVLDQYEESCAEGGAPVATLTATPSYLSGSASTVNAPSVTRSGSSVTSASSPQVTFVGTSTPSSGASTGTLTSPAAGTNAGTVLGSQTTSSEVNPFAQSGSGKIGVPAIPAFAGAVLGGLAVLL
ncbi:hypothetical protein OE88DRAFT_1659330 [Heliocybe sulcata]|uniref:Extracellular membrane protein CFEM domain-containing protein n=1 Tax=Heliocybe sulcata TaxID=5364 RepID=A0A5C3N2W4_9AGAM|nr:hypothetical protein OE88DRAFT_1659330 [Heliocybe sulcata]